jgi:hypothetical protein
MIEQVTIRVFEIVGSSLCVASDDGQKVHDEISAVLKKKGKARLSFLNVKSLTSAFLNTAVGQLYGEFSEGQIKSNLSVAEMEQDDLYLLKRVVDTAKQYFKDPERTQKAREEVLGRDGK